LPILQFNAFPISGKHVQTGRASRPWPDLQRVILGLCPTSTNYWTLSCQITCQWGFVPVRTWSCRLHHYLSLLHNSPSEGHCIVLHVHNLCLSSLLSIFQGSSCQLRRDPSMGPSQPQPVMGFGRVDTPADPPARADRSRDSDRVDRYHLISVGHNGSGRLGTTFQSLRPTRPLKSRALHYLDQLDRCPIGYWSGLPHFNYCVAGNRQQSSK